MSPDHKQENPSPMEWQEALELHPIYIAIAAEFGLEQPACPELDSKQATPTAQGMTAAQEWFAAMDERIQVHQLRQFLQTTQLATEKAVLWLLQRLLRKGQKGDSDRDKIDFLLVQFFSLAAPSRLDDADVDAAYVAQVLEPVLGVIDPRPPQWVSPLEQVLDQAKKCARLSELLESSNLEKGRKLKVGAGDNYYQPAAMVAFARFSFLMRRIFFRLMHSDLNAILDGLKELENRGTTTLDCRRAQFSRDEPVARLRMICQSWKVMFHAEYSSGQPLKMLVDLRQVMDEALTRSPGAKPGEKQKAVAAGSGFKVSGDDVPEFEVQSSNSAWNPDGQ
jgi:hypothetical protein